jgi:Mor family transcriptional regulator
MKFYDAGKTIKDLANIFDLSEAEVVEIIKKREL